MANSWQELEDYVMTLLTNDKPVKPKGSGNAKKEEDVVSNNIITQCKYTDNINMSILNKDLERLLEACKLQDKFPFFITGNKNNIILSTVINKDTEESINLFITFIQFLGELTKLNKNIKFVNIEQLEYINSQTKNLKNILKYIKDYYNDKLDKLDIKLKSKYDDLTICDLFEGEKDGIKP